jgi:hypothetical protein
MLSGWLGGVCCDKTAKVVQACLSLIVTSSAMTSHRSATGAVKKGGGDGENEGCGVGVVVVVVVVVTVMRSESPAKAGASRWLLPLSTITVAFATRPLLKVAAHAHLAAPFLSHRYRRLLRRRIGRRPSAHAASSSPMGAPATCMRITFTSGGQLQQQLCATRAVTRPSYSRRGPLPARRLLSPSTASSPRLHLQHIPILCARSHVLIGVESGQHTRRRRIRGHSRPA